MKHRIGITGSYGGLNLGDEAILASMLTSVRARGHVEVVVFSANPADTKARHGVRAVSIREMHRDEVLEELRTLDLLVVGGGGILFDGMAERILRDVNWARELGVPVMIFAVSAGPLVSPETRQLVLETLEQVDVITVRDAGAKRTLQDLGVSKAIEVTGDPALLLKPQPFTRQMLASAGVEPGATLVGFSVREPGPAAPDLDIDHYHTMLANAADFMVERFAAQVLFVPMEPGESRDPQHSHAVIARMAHAQRASVLKGDHASARILGLVGHMSFVVGMRLHFLIFSAIQHVPFVPLPYASKVSGLLADLEMPAREWSELNTGRLCAYLDQSWDTRRQIARRLSNTVPALQERARRTPEILSDLLDRIEPRKGRK
ncbi:MAG: polysaccharide pyruvyl transferase family protein [Vicinamibacterales bacterium]